MKPDSKLKERHSQKTPPENRPDVDAQEADSGYEDPTSKNDKKPDPNWQRGKYAQKQREGGAEEKPYDAQ